ncbi:putative monothiol glutaredoxin ycf64-like [Babesia sp. Xinjiang]|uniref:putative monothiol glutaredoxin ycf64-like n=1 Tax=Babesia sp. Xinjiang TaxID=462227 RepID=UPI000A25B3F0|nr:putative monothiol glutaredoxin ycf64-like [Babesia sp. Xinjiang]ORM39465.1 putative monothiol glutaredoxin ycf64-like [Babesia sp. Xinjiang]
MSVKIWARLFYNVGRLRINIATSLSLGNRIALCSGTVLFVACTYGMSTVQFSHLRPIPLGLHRIALASCEAAEKPSTQPTRPCCKQGCCGSTGSHPPGEDSSNIDWNDLPPLTPAVEERIKKEISQYKVVLFMKGTASKPACKYSRHAIDILKESRAPIIHTVNVLEDPDLRVGIKRFSKYPYIPQLYVSGQFVGGLETLVMMRENGSLKNLLAE